MLVPVEDPQAVPPLIPQSLQAHSAFAAPQDELPSGLFGHVADTQFGLDDGDAQPRSQEDIMASIRDKMGKNIDVTSTAHSVSRLSIDKKHPPQDDNVISSQPQPSALTQDQHAAASALEGRVSTEPKPPADQPDNGNDNLDEEEKDSKEEGEDPKEDVIDLDEDEEDTDEYEEAYKEIDFDVEVGNSNDIVQPGDDVDAFNTWAKAAKDTKAIEHFNEANMAKPARFFLMEVDDLKYKLRVNRQEGESEYVLSKKRLPGFIKDPFCYQLYDAFKAMLLKNSKSKGAIVAEEMGLGKTMEALILI